MPNDKPDAVSDRDTWRRYWTYWYGQRQQEADEAKRVAESYGATFALPESGTSISYRATLHFDHGTREVRGTFTVPDGFSPAPPSTVQSARPLPCDESLRVAEKLEDNWKEIAAFFQERNWPDTKLGNAASAIDWNMPVILKLLRTGEVRSTSGLPWVHVTWSLPDIHGPDVLVAGNSDGVKVWQASPFGPHDPAWLKRYEVTHWTTLPAIPSATGTPSK